MPRTRSLAWSELKIGVLTIVALVIAAVLIFTLTGTSGFFWQRYPLKTRFLNVAGLAPGSPVRVAGVEVGSVREIEFAGEEVDVTFEVRKDQRPRITDKSVATLGSVSLLGEGAVDITPSTSGTTVRDYGYVHAGKPKGSLSDVSEQATVGIEEITKLVQDVRAGRGTVGKLMTDDSLFKSLKSIAADGEKAVASLREAADQAKGAVADLRGENGPMKGITGSLQQVKAGNARGLAVTTLKRANAAPDVPTLAEAGVPGFDVSAWFAFYTPARTPAEIVGKLNTDIVAALGHPPVKERLAQLGADVVGSTPQALAQHIKAEMDKWGPVIRDAGIRVDG